MFLRFVHYDFLYTALPIFLVAILYRLKFYKFPIYVYPLTKSLSQAKLLKKAYHKQILFALRAAAILCLIFLVARPQWVDEKSNLNVEGIDIAISLDVSGSMQVFDDLQDRRQRIEVAKQEAIRFVEKRTNDPIGVVIFGRDALTLCPLTLDKKMLKEIIGSLKLGTIDPRGTFLGTGLATAVNRLKHSKAKSKIIILLTDGMPTPPEKINPETAIELAKQFEIKVYTVGIGNEHGGYVQDGFFGIQQAGIKLNDALLKDIAEQTGGKYFKAGSPREMRTVYDTINKLEKTKIESNMFHNYYEAFLLFIWIIFLLLGIEFFLKLWLWRGI